MQQDSFAKINVFLKITGRKGGLHSLFSRFCRVSNLFDVLSWTKKPLASGFSVRFESTFLSHEQCRSLSHNNTILKTYQLLLPYLSQEQRSILEYTEIVVDKNIPLGSGLGGGSSNAAAFLKLIQHVLELRIDIKILHTIATQVGSDVPFFIYDWTSANVSGVGDEVSEFREVLPEIEILTPPISCLTPDVYAHYSQEFFTHLSAESHQHLASMLSVDIVRKYNLMELNDLAKSVFALYPRMLEYAEDGWFLSGSGSSFFRLST